MAGTELCVKLGNQYPYDMTGSGRFRKPKDWAVVAARGVLSDLCDRRGIKHGFNDIDHGIRKEIVDDLAAIIRLAAKEG